MDTNAIRITSRFPVVMFFNPFGVGVWLATELDEDGDIIFGLADLGYLELGSWSLEELRSVRLPFCMGIERDLLFTGDFPISVWVDAARETGSIRAAASTRSVPGLSGHPRKEQDRGRHRHCLLRRRQGGEAAPASGLRLTCVARHLCRG